MAIPTLVDIQNALADGEASIYSLWSFLNSFSLLCWLQVQAVHPQAVVLLTRFLILHSNERTPTPHQHKGSKHGSNNTLINRYAI
jgi:hypothetical protein